MTDPELIPPVARITITRARMERVGSGPTEYWLYTVTTAGNYTASGTLSECRTIALKRRRVTGLDISEDWQTTAREHIANKAIREQHLEPHKTALRRHLDGEE